MKIHGLGEARPAPMRNSEPEATSAPTRPGEPSAFSRIVSSLGKEVDAGEKTMSQALHGGSSLGPSDLLALQAGVYRYSEAVDLAAKLVDRTSGSVKTVVQGQ